MENISDRAIINKSAKLGKNVKVFPNAIIDEDVVIGDGTIINSNAIIRSGARIGKNCEIFPGAIISEINQIKSERILELKFNKGTMYIELFNKGNIIFADPDGQIIITLKKHIMKDRQLAKGEHYEVPTSFDTFHSTKEEYTEFITSLIPDGITASKFFATHCILGGKNSELVCSKLGLTVDDKIESLIGKEKEIVQVFEDLLKEDANFENNEKEYFETEANISMSKYKAQIEKVEKIIKRQKQTLTKTHTQIETNSKVGEFIYNNYPFFDELKKAYEYSIQNNLKLKSLSMELWTNSIFLFFVKISFFFQAPQFEIEIVVIVLLQV